MPTLSAGLLLYRRTDAGLEVLIAHMGGPFWTGKDERAWSIPKGEYLLGEDPLTVARREFEEELGTAGSGCRLPSAGRVPAALGQGRDGLRGRGDLEVDTVTSNTFPLEWPPRSGRIVEFPEIDDARWVPVEVARAKLDRRAGAALDALDG